MAMQIKIFFKEKKTSVMKKNCIEYIVKVDTKLTVFLYENRNHISVGFIRMPLKTKTK